MGMATGNHPHPSPTATYDNYSAARIAAAPPAKPRRGPKRRKRVEEELRDLIKAGIVRVTRRRGQPPLIEWL